ncbi:uncharacterized protein BT62DRAFT_199141 [Guyanagaster necrorhizus]|uniref:Uncharacterized protein n=1 Tax=Guyanagaster necrorhizus TaxID=856835 RepID=A0A9P7VQA0_9AGAR|nr:uncharacterized protein BT62DRAFT_199141 [Guyanagaster necrorhizus MCA 3950]KAG7444924.1 hypothetical protein BT62DRAFT_199141 [Guyanagaster necrorhizus MCA 3950]
MRVPSFSRRERALVRQRDRQLRLEILEISRNEYLIKLASEFGKSAPVIDRYIHNTTKDNLAWDEEYIDGRRKDFFGYDLGVKDYCLTQSASKQTASTSRRELTQATLVDGHSNARLGDATAATGFDSSATPGQKRKRTTELTDSASVLRSSDVSNTLPRAVDNTTSTTTNSSFSRLSSQLAVLPFFKRKHFIEEPNIPGHNANFLYRLSQPMAQEPSSRGNPDSLGPNPETPVTENSKSHLTCMSASPRPGPVIISAPNLRLRPAKPVTQMGAPTLKPRLIRHIQASDDTPGECIL